MLIFPVLMLALDYLVLIPGWHSHIWKPWDLFGCLVGPGAAFILHPWSWRISIILAELLCSTHQWCEKEAIHPGQIPSAMQSGERRMGVSPKALFTPCLAATTMSPAKTMSPANDRHLGHISGEHLPGTRDPRAPLCVVTPSSPIWAHTGRLCLV